LPQLNLFSSLAAELIQLGDWLQIGPLYLLKMNPCFFLVASSIPQLPGAVFSIVGTEGVAFQRGKVRSNFWVRSLRKISRALGLSPDISTSRSNSLRDNIYLSE